jgi:hypothetical protein
MMKLIAIKKSTRPGKKWMALFQDNQSGRKRTTHFGAEGMEDFTLNKDPEQAQRYRTRHAKDLLTNDPTRAGYLSYYILWSSPNMLRNVVNFKRKFSL